MWTGYDHHCDCSLNGKSRVFAEVEPGSKCDSSDAQRYYGKPSSGIVCQVLSPGFALLSLPDKLDDLTEVGLGSDLLNLYRYRALAIDGPAYHVVSRSFPDRPGFACEHGLIYACLSLDHRSVDGYLLPGFDQDSVSRLKRFDLDLHRLAIFYQVGFRGHDLDQLLQGSGSSED